MKIPIIDLIKLIIPLAAGFLVWYVQKKKELTIQSSQYKKQKQLDALMAIWGLLRFMAQNENT
ncbi:hypothetical protein, partial [Aquimarina rhabdastrellae]